MYNELPFEVIFVTSFDQYAISAIKFNALDYLLKPIEIDDLKLAIEKGKKNILEKEDNYPQIINLIQNLEANDNDRKMAIHISGKVKMIAMSEILFIAADGRYSEINMLNKEVFLTSKNLLEFEDFYPESSPFIRISKSVIINSKHILEYSKGEPFSITLVGDVIFEVARRKKPEVLEKLKRLK